MTDELLELARLRADLPSVDEAAMARARATLVHTATSPRRATSTRWRRLPVGIAATAAVATFLVVSSASDNAPTASAVTFNDDGTVTIELADVLDIAAANKTLRDKGVHAELVGLQPEGSCAPDTELGDPLPAPAGLIVADKWPEQILTFRSDLIPADTTLVMLAVVKDGRLGLGKILDQQPPDENGSQQFRAAGFVPAELHPQGAATCVDDPFAMSE